VVGCRSLPGRTATSRGGYAIEKASKTSYQGAIEGAGQVDRRGRHHRVPPDKNPVGPVEKSVDAVEKSARAVENAAGESSTSPLQDPVGAVKDTAGAVENPTREAPREVTIENATCEISVKDTSR
jgi:hypothetical protein